MSGVGVSIGESRSVVLDRPPASLALDRFLGFVSGFESGQLPLGQFHPGIPVPVVIEMLDAHLGQRPVQTGPES